jgi:RNA polymerase sigma factor (sigma-70 family)
MSAGLEAAFADHRRFLWGLSYRMLGDAAEAEDVVSETFARALERPPADTTRPWRPWLVRVAMNLSRDRLRARKRRPYPRSMWLPQLVEDDDLPEPAYEAPSTEARYDLLESISVAFLVALETLTPKQRAVLLLRDAYGYSVRETADALEMSEANIKTTLHRARAAMADYQRAERPAPAEANARTREAIMRLLAAFASGDQRALEQALVDDVRVIGDGGGEFFAAPAPIVGRDLVLRFFGNVLDVMGQPATIDVRSINGRPAIVSTFDSPRPGWAPRSIMCLDVDAAGQVLAVHNLMARPKITRVRFS